MAPHHDRLLRCDDIVIIDRLRSIPFIMWTVTKMAIFLLALAAAFGLLYYLVCFIFYFTGVCLGLLIGKIREWRERSKERSSANGEDLHSIGGPADLAEDDDGGERNMDGRRGDIGSEKFYEGGKGSRKQKAENGGIGVIKDLMTL